MENRKLNWNKILNGIIAFFGIALVALFIGICFLSPIASIGAKALSREDIEARNINFVSAKTRIRQANNYERVWLTNNSDSQFYSYKYNYLANSVQNTKLYSKSDNTSTLKSFSSNNGNVNLEVDGSYMSVYEDYTSARNTDFIPASVTSFKNNTTGNIEDIFYDESDEGDFILLNNHTSHTSIGNYDVENFYLGFGTEYLNDSLKTTPLHSLRVEGFLYNKNQKHNLSLQDPHDTNLDDGKNTLVYYWNQYFDLHNLKGFKTGEQNSTYDIEDQQGKYVFNFYFISYEKDSEGNLVQTSETEELFTYTFYLLDSANYDSIPTLNNATLGTLEQDKAREYFYNFTNDRPYLSYDPESFNISFKRENREIVEEVTSSYNLTTYEYKIGENQGRLFPLGVITYRVGNIVEKQVFILVYYNDDKNLVEYLYLANNSHDSISTSGVTYVGLNNLLEENTLSFEYKITQVLTTTAEDDTTKYTLDTYYTNAYKNHKLDTSFNHADAVANGYSKVSSEYISVNSNGEYKYNSDKTNGEIDIITISNNSVTLTENLGNGVILNKNTLEKVTTGNITDNVENIGFKLIQDANTKAYTLTKSYVISEEGVLNEKTQDIELKNTTADGIYEIKDPADTNFTIKYTVSNSTITSLTIVSHTYTTENKEYSFGNNVRLLSRLNNITQIPIDIQYNLQFDDLGIYTFTYNYNCLTCDENNSSQTVVNNTINSKNILKITDFNLKFEEPASDQRPSSSETTKDISLNVWGYLDADNTVTLNGVKYTYDQKNDSLTIGTNSEPIKNISKNITVASSLGGNSVNATYSIRTNFNNQKYLNIAYHIADITKNISPSEKVNYFTNNIAYVTNGKTITTNKITLKNQTTGSVISPDNIDNSNDWTNVKSLLSYLSKNNTYTEENRYHKSPNLNSDILHFYGSYAYFNKEDNDTDSGYAKFELNNNRLSQIYESDLTKYYEGNKQIKAENTNDATFTTLKSNLKQFTNKILQQENTKLSIDNLIISDITPVLFKNLSTLLYNSTNSKLSESIIYRYPHYSIDKATNTIIYGDAEEAIYTKDTYCHYDGLYEIVVFYKYDGYKSLTNGNEYYNTVFYQLFTFIIDNSSPKLSVKVQDVDDQGKPLDTYNTELGINKYTNRNVEISWNIPSYFKNDVYIEIKREAFDTTTSNNFTATYQKGDIIVNSGSRGYVTGVTEFIEPKLDDTIYKVYIKSSNELDCNGNYRITLHYSSRGASTVSEDFIIDKVNISGTKTLPAAQNEDGSYSVNDDIQNYNANSQIINYDFTFRYDAKKSGAQIYTYWYKIDLVKYNEYGQLINTDANKTTGITTDYKVDGNNTDSFEYGNQYAYNYNTDNFVASTNYFTSSSSSIFIFKLVDEAGNECRYVVFYDKTTPRFVLSPTPNNSSNIVNNTTELIWGDYKAIWIDTNNEINWSEEIRDYDKRPSTITDNLQEALVYIQSSSNFNDTQIQLINGKYYLLLPIDSVSIIDNSSLNNANISFTGTLPEKYYFFPSNPISEKEESDTNSQVISLPVIENNKILRNDTYDITSVSYVNSLNLDNETINRFLSTTGTEVYGAIGQGEFTYKIYDKQKNLSTGTIWMNLDKTQTMAQGIFDSKTGDDPSKAIAITGEEGTYSASKLYISSLDSDSSNGDIPTYKLTYKYYQFNSSLYEDLIKNYNLYSVAILNSESTNIPANLTITGSQTYLQLIYETKDKQGRRTYYIELTDEDGNKSAKHSYPYALEGQAVVTDSSGNPQHIYTNNSSSYTVTEGTGEDQSKRLYSTIINPTADTTGKSSVVTQEGLYIFKREYTDSEIKNNPDLLGLDKRIIYRIYYVDRTGIINVATLNSIANRLSDDSIDNKTQANNFGFVLGSDYSADNENLKKYITANTINNSQVSLSSNASNTHTTSKDLFKTNKIQVAFNVTADKYNYEAFLNSDLASAIQTQLSKLQNGDTEKLVNDYLFNKKYYSLNKYKINLTLKKGNSIIIDESSSDPNQIFNNKAISSYLKGSAKTSETYEIEGDDGITRDVRTNNFNLFLEDSNSNPYYIELKDNSGYKLWENGVIADTNYQANQLDMSFYIKHEAPTGDSYGKYYGRHDYDEDKNSGHSIPINEDGTYGLLTKYLQGGQLEPLSRTVKSQQINSNEGNIVQLYSTNNETLIFTFTITQSDTMAQIDPNNIKIYKDNRTDNNLIFNRVNGTNLDTTLVSAARQNSSFFSNVIGGVTYYAIVIFDNNLDDILNVGEEAYSNFRLLNKDQNPDQATYSIVINYVGNKDNYIKEDNRGNQISYSSSVYEITVDRNKPTYNLTKLMSLDKFVYNPAKTQVTTANYEKTFETYKEYYNFRVLEAEKQYDFERSYLENYFFALDYRTDTSFVFESVSELDSNNGIYIRGVDKDNYKFSITPDDYKAYYEATYLPGHPQFAPNKATILNSYSEKKITADGNYYLIQYDKTTNTLKASDLMNFLEEDSYYEIIECDEAGNYRVYAVYLSKYKDTEIQYTFKPNNNSFGTNGTINYNNNTSQEVSGVEFNLTNLKTSDYFTKINVAVNSTKLKETLSVTYEPFEKCVYVKTSTNTIRDRITDVSYNDFTKVMVETINSLIKNYYDIISTTTSQYYSQYGYTIKLTIVDRIGIRSSISTNNLYDYEITYNVAGSVLEPTFKNLTNSFQMTIPAQTGTTYITHIDASIFSSGWVTKDPDDLKNSFKKSEAEFKKGTVYTLNKGVYKFEITDNFQRKNTYFYEFGSSTVQAGGLLQYSDKNILHTDGYNYTSKSAKFVYDSSVYDIFIQYIGDTAEGDISYAEKDKFIVYSSNKSYSETYLRSYGISVATVNNISSISFSGVSSTTLSKYFIKTIPASMSTKYGYTWGQEELDKNIMVYDRKLAIYTGIQNVVVRNSNGNVLDTTEHLHLSEDFEVSLGWTGYDPEKQIDFNSLIYLERTYTQNNVVRTERLSNANTYRITKPGDYVAYVFNALNNKSGQISFTRGEGEIGIYSIFNINNKTMTKLSPSAKVDSEDSADENRQIIVFNYFTTIDYFSFKDTSTNSKIEIDDLTGYDQTPIFDLNNVEIDKTSTKYLDIQVKSDLSIFVEFSNLSLSNNIPCAVFRVYSKNSNDEEYTYRYARVYFLKNLEGTEDKLAITTVKTLSDNSNIYSSSPIIKRPDRSLIVSFKFQDGVTTFIDGDTIYVDRYFNGELIETYDFTTISENTECKFVLTQVGLHKFVVRDLAGRIQTFGSNENVAKSLQIYLINQILFTVNDSSPINNQIFNDTVNIKIQSELAGLTLYNTRTLGVTVLHNGQEVSVANLSEFSFSEPGSYSVTMVATTVLSDDSSIVADQEISTNYQFVIVKPYIALKSFNVSKGTGFAIEKLVKIVNSEREEITDKYQGGDNLLWLTHEEQGNSTFEITLKYYDSNLKSYRSFTFNVWINNEQPVIISSIPNGSSSKDTITLSYNAGIIYSQVGNCKIYVNDIEYANIDENSERVVSTIEISKKGTYWIKILSEDGTLISTYKYTKNDPISNTTKIVLISVGIGVAVLVGIFFFIRRKGKYR